MATKNVTISQPLVALFNIHNVQTRWLRGLSGTYVFADENGSFPQLESFDVTTVRVNSPPTPGREMLKSFPINFSNIDIANRDKPRIISDF